MRSPLEDFQERIDHIEVELQRLRSTAAASEQRTTIDEIELKLLWLRRTARAYGVRARMQPGQVRRKT